VCCLLLLLLLLLLRGVALKCHLVSAAADADSH
jgi:hypothetical protein